MPATESLVEGLDHPEGVCWDPRSGDLWAGGEGGQLYRVDLDARTWVDAARAPGFVLGLAVDGAGRLAVCCDTVCVLEDGHVRTLSVVVSCYRPDRIVHVDAAGAVETLAEDPQRTILSAPTNADA